MYNTSMIREMLSIAKSYGFGIDIADVPFSWEAIKNARDSYITRLNGIYERNLAGSKVEYVYGTASFIGPKTLQVGDRTITVQSHS